MTNKFEIRYSSEFFEELDAIAFYIKNELKNKIAANKLVKKVEIEIEKRQKNPKSYEQYKTNGGYSYALQVIQKYFNISKENTISFGDDYSDLEVFEKSGKGVAMGNAIVDLKQMADYITDDNNSNGIANFINQYIL